MRKNFITLLKVISVFLVILIHSISRCWDQMDVNSFMFKAFTFVDVIARIGVPIFLMCSGNIFLNRDDSLFKILFKYILKIYLIFILFNMIYKVIDVYMYKDGVMSFDLIMLFIKNSIMLQGVYHLWYLKVVIITYLFIPIFKYFIKYNKVFVDMFILIILLLFFLSPHFINNNKYHLFIIHNGYILYFYLGYFLYKYKNKILTLLMIPSGIFGFIYTYIKTINISKLYLKGNELYLNYNRFNILLMSILIFTLFIYLEDYIKNKKYMKVINYISKYNLTIYLVHGLVIGGLSYLKIINITHYNHLYMLFINMFIIYVCSFILSFIILLIKDKIIYIIKVRRKVEVVK